MPWRSMRRPVEVANPELVGPASHELPLAAMARRGWQTAVWNPYAACGTVGFLSWDAGILAPTTSLMLSWTDAAHRAGAMVLLKLLLAFWGTWLLARSEGAGEAAATTGAVIYALALPLTARWLWPSSATAAALPLVLWAVARAFGSARPWRWGAAAALAWLAFLAGGDPAVTAGGTYLLAGWLLALWACGAAERRRALAVSLAAALVAVAVLTPSFGLYRAARSTAGPGEAPAHVGLGVDGLRLLIDPFALGDPRQDTFTPPPALPGLGLHDLALATGSIALALALLGLVSRRRGVGFWALVAAVFLLPVLWTPAARLEGLLPGLGRAGPWELSAVPALATALLAAAGVQALAGLVRPGLARWVVLLTVAVVLQQGTVAGHLLTWLEPADAVMPVTPALRLLERAAREAPVRVAPLGDVLLPDTATCFGLEDLRASRGVSKAYVRLLLAVDPQSSGHYGTGLRLNPATVDLEHPYFEALGPRFVLEDPGLHLVEFGLGQRTVEIEPRRATLGPLGPGRDGAVVQELHLPPGVSRLALNAMPSERRVEGHLEVVLHDEILDRPVARWTVDAAVLAREGFRWLDLPARVATAHRMRLTIVPRLTAGRLSLLRTGNPAALDGPLLWRGRPVHGDLGLSFDTSGFVRVQDGPDLRVWENRHAGSRFWIVRDLRPGSLDTVVEADPPFELRRTAVIGRDRMDAALRAIRPVRPRHTERLVLDRWTAARYELEADLEAPGLLVGSIPAEPRLWRAEIDGRPVEPVTTDGLFLGLPVPAGTHTITLYAALPGWWLVLSGLGLVGMIGLAVAAWQDPREERP
ncbi:MAG TPA: hypothetical protein ENK19_00935 [Acidobacteria bacterium]|nr:hypothetical protein [Acidobacteriota bacterium]